MRNHLMEMAGVLACVIGVFAMSSCATAPPTVQGKTDIRDEAATTLSLAQRSDPSLIIRLELPCYFPPFCEMSLSFFRFNIANITGSTLRSFSISVVRTATVLGTS